MDVQLSCGSSLPYILVIEALACSNHVDPSLLLDLLKRTPQIFSNFGKNAIELVSLKFLESLFTQRARASPVCSDMSEKVRLDPSDHCEDVLRRILSETSQSHPKPAGSEISKWDLQPFIEHKKSNLPKYALKQLKDAILTGSLSISASLKEQSGLPVGTHAAPENGKCDTPRVEGNDTDYDDLMPRDFPEENAAPINRKKRADENIAEDLCTTSTCVSSVKKNKQDIIRYELNIGGKKVPLCYNIGGKKVPLCYNIGGKKVPLCYDELNNKSNEQQRQNQNIEEEDCKNKACDLKTSNSRKENVHEIEENDQVSNDNEGTNHGKTDVAVKENPSSLVPPHAHSQDSLETTDSRNQRLLADTSKRYREERCILDNRSFGEVMKQNGSPGDSNDQYNSSKGLVENVHILRQCGTEMLNGVAMRNSKSAENRGKCYHHGLISTNEDIDKFYQNVSRNVPSFGEAEDGIDASSDNDGYHDEKTTIASKKRIFLSSQCTYSQDLLATTYRRELNFCMKCLKGGNLLTCTSDSCPIVIHESCLGSDESFDTRETFYCPFCAYSRAVSKYIEVKKYASLARHDLATFICFGPQHESNKQNDGLPKVNELNQINVVEKVGDQKYRKELENEQARPSDSRFDHNPPSGRNAADSTIRLVQSLKRDRQDGKKIRQESQSPRARPRKRVAAESVRNSQVETKSCKVSGTYGTEKLTDDKSRKGVACPPETDSPCERKCSQISQSTDAEEISEEDTEDSGASKYFISVRNQEKQNLNPAKSQNRKKRLPWTSKEEDILKEGMLIFCSPHNMINPWKKILEHGEGEFHPSRSTTDLKDKWRNMCKVCPKSK